MLKNRTINWLSTGLLNLCIAVLSVAVTSSAKGQFIKVVDPPSGTVWCVGKHIYQNELKAGIIYSYGDVYFWLSKNSANGQNLINPASTTYLDYQDGYEIFGNDGEVTLNEYGYYYITAIEGENQSYSRIVPVVDDFVELTVSGHEVDVGGNYVAYTAGSGYVTITANLRPSGLSDADAAQVLNWTGGAEVVSARVRRVPKSTVQERLVSAWCCNSPSDYADIWIISMELIVPQGSPVTAPQAGVNEFTFSADPVGVLSLYCTAAVYPSGAATVVKQWCSFDADYVGNSMSGWSELTADGLFLDQRRDYWPLPSANSGFGPKKASVWFNGVKRDEKDWEAFYPATVSNHPGGGSDPNWFYYYKQNAGGGAYTYFSAGRSYSGSALGDSTIGIGNEAYEGDTYFTTQVVNGQLSATGESQINRYYANFLGVLAHERQHANNQTNAGPPTDADRDRLSNAFETGTSQTNPNVDDSASGVYPGELDREVYANGPVEEQAIQSADTSMDWANPGTNSGQ